MIVYRLGKTRFINDLSGQGARLFGGRWNHVGTPCTYTSENRALSVLEYSVNIKLDEIPRTLSLASIEIPANEIRELKLPELPGNWMQSPAPASTKDLVTTLLKKMEAAVIKIPSTVIPLEFNFILNPLHPKASHFKIVEIIDFVYDVRIKNV